MAVFTIVSQSKLSGAGYHSSSAASDSFGLTDFVYQDYRPGSSEVTLKHGILDNTGSPIVTPTAIARYRPGTTDQNTGATFDNTYSSFELGQGNHAVFYTTPTHAQGYAPSDLTSLKLQEFDDSGNQILGPTTLALGGKTGVKDLYAVSESSGPDFGNSFVVTYATFNPQSGREDIKYETFDDAGNALGGGVIGRFNDGKAHGLTFGTFYSAANPNANGSPDFLLMKRTPDGTRYGVQAELLDANMQPLASKSIYDAGPNGEPVTAFDRFNYLRPGSGSQDNSALLSQTFQYVDAAGHTHEEIGIEKVNPTTLAVEAHTEFEVTNGNKTGVGLTHLGNGDYVAAYVDGSQTYVKEFNAKLHQIGQTYALPHDNNGFDNLVGLSDSQFEIFWRELVSPGSSSQTVQHSAILTTATPSHDIVAASHLAAPHKTTA